MGAGNNGGKVLSNANMSRRYFLNLGAATAVATVLGRSAVAKEILATASQDEGPFYPKRQQLDKNADMTRFDNRSGHAAGELLEISGRILDTRGNPVKGAIIDVWQADSNGRYHHEDAPATTPLDPNFQYWAQLKTGMDGRYQFKTIKPGQYPVMEGWVRPPHIHFKVACRGLRELITQMYFGNEPLNRTDKLLLEAPKDKRTQLEVTIHQGKGHFDMVLEQIG